MEIQFDNLKEAALVPGTVYKGGTKGNVGDDPLSKLLSVGNSGGFRTSKRKDKSKDYAYIVLYFDNSKATWKNEVDYENSVLTYYGDNQKPGNDMFKTKHKGNEILRSTFDKLTNENLNEIPPFFAFQKHGNGRDVEFIGLAVPGTSIFDENQNLERKNFGDFENYIAKFTIVKTEENEITKEWIYNLKFNHDSNIEYAPKSWKKFITNKYANIETQYGIKENTNELLSIDKADEILSGMFAKGYDENNTDSKLIEVLIPEPKLSKTTDRTTSRKTKKVDYIQKQKANVETGYNGEKLVLNYERQRLIDLGYIEYSEKIEWCSTEDDTLGYDIKSYDVINGSIEEIYIEVKTTTANLESDFFISNNELEKFKEQKNKYHIYRVSISDKGSASFYRLSHTDLDTKFDLKEILYKATIKKYNDGEGDI